MNSAANEPGMSAERLARVVPFIRGYVEAGRHYGAEIIVARNDRIMLHEAVGARGPGGSPPLEKGAVYSIFSVSKTFTSVLALNALERGRFSVTTKMSEIIPEFSGGRRANITIYHLLSHQ